MKDTTHVVVSGLHKTSADAAIEGIRKSIANFGQNAQFLHILLVNLIREGNKWKAVFSTFRQPDLDNVPDPVITHCFLPSKYQELYNALAPEVDYIDIIYDEKIWKDIKKFLLDIYFYQAVNFKQMERLTDMPYGYFTETGQQDIAQSLENELTLDHTGDNNNATDNEIRSSSDFYQNLSFEEDQRRQADKNTQTRQMHDRKTRALLRELGLFNPFS